MAASSKARAPAAGDPVEQLTTPNDLQKCTERSIGGSTKKR